MRRNLVLLLMLSVMLPSFAQKGKKAAREVLDKVSETISGNNYEVLFSVINYVEEHVQGVANGKLLLNENKFTCETEDMKTWYDGKTQWSLIYDSEEVNITEPTDDELLEINPYALLKVYKKGYSYNLVTEKTIENNPFVEIELKANSKEKDLQKLTLWINTKTYEPHTIDIVRSNGDLMHINIDDVKLVKKVDKLVYTFNPKEYPNVDVIDLR